MNSNFGNITAVVVTYHPDEKCVDHLHAILSQVQKLIIVDNASNESALECIKKFCSKHPKKTTLIIQSKNIGLSKAQNQGIVKALKQNCDWVLLVDDDSCPEPDMIRNLQLTYTSQDEKSQIAMLVPYIKETKTSREPLYLKQTNGIMFTRQGFTGSPFLFISCAIASGSLIKASVLKEHGLMHEDFFIDYIDTEYCLRLRTVGYRIVAAKNAVLHHTLGAKTEHNILGIRMVATNHSPQRRYTIYRNRVITWKRYLGKVPSYIIYDMIAAVYDVSRIIFCEKQKGAKLVNIIKGTLNGLLSAYK